jgi:hypothetical protein
MLQPHAGYEKLQSVYGAYSITIFARLVYGILAHYRLQWPFGAFLYINLSPPSDYTVMAVWRALSYKKVHQLVTGYHTNQITQQNSLQRAGEP